VDKLYSFVALLVLETSTDHTNIGKQHYIAYQQVIETQRQPVKLECEVKNTVRLLKIVCFVKSVCLIQFEYHLGLLEPTKGMRIAFLTLMD